MLLKESDQGLWPAVSFGEDPPEELAEGQAVLRGKLDGGFLSFGIETFFFPEKDRERLNRLFAERLDELRAEVRVTDEGRAALVGIRVGEKPLEEFLSQEGS